MATTYKDYYSTLGVSKTATPKEVKAAYRKLARKHHPDVNPGDSAAEARFKEINEANEVLSDPEKRTKYDTYGERWEEIDAWEKAGRPGAQPGSSPFGQQGHGQQGRGQGEPQFEYRSMSQEDLEDLFGDSEPFSDFFNGMFRGRGAGGAGARGGARGTTRTPRPRRGSDLEAEIDISLEEAYSGTTRTLEIAGETGTRRVQIRIPAGITDGARVRAAGQGGAGAQGGEAGDIFVRVHVLPHPVLRREGDTLYTRVEVPLDVALLGGEVEVPTLKGTRVKLRIPAGTQNGAKLRLKGLGMPHLKGGGSGDLIAEVDVRLPVPVPPQARALAEALRESREGSHAGR
ncbi:MAG TPA: J domain-containing protein [Candidatus Dormibacteraeota bacterium]|nr:J domain-containing protein [Candidatus Dormibacteraeota bacterium]